MASSGVSHDRRGGGEGERREGKGVRGTRGGGAGRVEGDIAPAYPCTTR